MEVSITARPDAVGALGRLHAVLGSMHPRIVACSGGIDSLLLAHVAHEAAPAATLIAHTVTPAVPGDGTARVVDHAERHGWETRIVRSGEFDDEAYLSNPTDRCYHCKSNLYDAVMALRGDTLPDAVILSGANLDDLGEYRPGLAAAAEREVRHPYVEAEVTKAEIRSIARHLGLAEADLPASPCLASRLYTGTRVTPSMLRAIEAGEALVRERSGIGVVRCRVRDTAVLVEVADVDRDLIDDRLLVGLAATMRSIEPSITSVELDARAYEPGRAFVGASGTGHRSERSAVDPVGSEPDGPTAGAVVGGA
ncbi:MAG: ATPase [Ilumatobacter sp.]|uniref:ATPase n=2 Tax=Ilumatobacter sp. TaxID=1967498 RepID=UPI0032981AE8